jgi:hypothetical protein
MNMKKWEVKSLLIDSFKQINMTFVLLFVAYLAIAGFVGGLGLAVLMCSILMSASFLSSKSEYLISRQSLVLSYLLHIICLAIYFTFGLSFARNYLGFLFRKHIDTESFHPLQYVHPGTEFSRMGSLAVIALPTLFLIVKAVLEWGDRPNTTNKRGWSDGVFAAWATLLPFIYIAIIKFQDPWQALNFAMSGDGRNHLQFVEQIRTTSHTTLSMKRVGVPVLGNAVSALISAANGAHGFLDVRDIWGIQSIYIFSAGILTAVAALFLTTFFKKDKFTDYLVLVIPMICLSIFVSSSGYVVFPILYDGFFSLYFGIAVLSLVICYFFLKSDEGKWRTTVILIVSTWCVATAYTYLAPAALVVTVTYIYFQWRKLEKSNFKNYSMLCVIVFAPVGVILLRRQFIAEFKLRGQMPGSVWPTNAVLLLVFLLVALLLVVVSRGATRRLFLCINLIILSAAAMLIYIEFLPANRGASYSYYSSKLIIGTVGTLLILVPLLISFFFRTDAWEKISSTKNKTMRIIAVASISALPIVTIHSLNRYHPVIEINRGWVNPDAKSIETVINQWKSGPNLYFQFAKNGELFEYPSFSADRMLNFWSPISWDASGEYMKFYTFAYFGQASSDPAILCDIIKTKPITVVTRNPELPTLVGNSCGPTATKFKIEK